VKAFCDLSVSFDRDAFRTHYIKSTESRSSTCTWKSLNLCLYIFFRDMLHPIAYY